MRLTDQERQRIYQAVMADKSQTAADADALAPASELSTEQALNQTHALPDSLQDIAVLKTLTYLKTKNKVLLIEPSTRIVVERDHVLRFLNQNFITASKSPSPATSGDGVCME